MNRILLPLLSAAALLFSSSSFATYTEALDQVTEAQWDMAYAHQYGHTGQRYVPSSSAARTYAYYTYVRAVNARNHAYAAWLESPGGAGETYAYRAYSSLYNAAYYARLVYLYGNSYIGNTISYAAAGDRYLSLAAWYNGLLSFNGQQ